MPDTLDMPTDPGPDPVAVSDASAELVAGQLVMDAALLGFLALALALPVYALLRALGRAPLQFGRIDAQPLRAIDLVVACSMVALLLVMMVGGPQPIPPSPGGPESMTEQQTGPEPVDPAAEVEPGEGEAEAHEEAGADGTGELVPLPQPSGLGLWFSAVFWGTICLAVGLYLGGMRGIALVSWLGLTRHGPIRTLGMALAALILALPVIIVANAAFQFFILKPNFPELGVQEAVRIFMTTSDFGVRLALVVSAVIVAPIAEELLFRGFLYPAIKRFTDPVFAMVCSALLFAAVHNNLPALVPLLVLGIAFAMAYEYSGSLWVPIWMHALFNLTNITIMMMAVPLPEDADGQGLEPVDPVAGQAVMCAPQFNPVARP